MSGCDLPDRPGVAVTRVCARRFLVDGRANHRDCVNQRRMVRIEGTIAGPSL